MPEVKLISATIALYKYRNLNENFDRKGGIEIEAFRSDTGESVGTLKASKEFHHKNYSIKRLNMRIWEEGMDWVYLQVATSRTNTMIFNALKHEIDKHNEIRTNITHLAEKINVDPSTIRKMIKRLKDINFLYTQERGVYRVNPFVVKAKGITNEELENNQKWWEKNIGLPTIDKLGNEKKF